MKRNSHMTLDRAERVCRVFGLNSFPLQMPYDVKCGLRLPDQLTAEETKQIAAATAVSLVEKSPWYIGDLLNWLKARPDAPISREWVKQRLFEVGRYVQRTFDNYCSVCRTFPLEKRHPNLSFRHHDVLRARWIRASVREELFDRAERERLSLTALMHEREKYRHKITDSGKSIGRGPSLMAHRNEPAPRDEAGKHLTNGGIRIVPEQTDPKWIAPSPFDGVTLAQVKQISERTGHSMSEVVEILASLGSLS